MLRTAGFVDVEVVDLTEEYGATQRRWIDAHGRHEIGMRAALGDEVFDERLAMRRRTMQLISDGLLSRFRYVGRRPTRSR